MNKLQLTAIVVTVAIVMPIGLGYLMAVEEVERTGWQSTSSANLSDLMLNSETEYYTVSNVPLNNAEIFVNGSDLMVPEYVSLGSTATSLPEYTTVSTGVSASKSTQYATGTYTITPSEDVGAIVIDADGRVRVSVGSINAVLYPDTVTIQSYGGRVYVNDRSAATGVLSDVTITLTVDAGYTAPVESFNFVDLPLSGDYSFVSTGYSVARIVADGATHYVRAQKLSKTANTVVAGILSETYNDITSIEVVTAGQNLYGSTSISTTVSGSYGDPAYGWRMPGMALYTKDWANGQQNMAVEFYVSMADGDYFTIVPWVDGDTDSLLVRYSDGQTTLEPVIASADPPQSTNLGNYPNLRIVVKSDGIDVYGIPEWPPMFVPANDINSYSYEFDDIGDFSRVRFLTFGNTKFRVDSATIVAGTFPVADDFSLDLGQYWPGNSWAIRMPNIGIYGDSITFGGNIYDVENGRITLLDGMDLSLLDVTLSGTFAEGIWTYSINSVEQSTSSELLPVIFSGVWSATVTGYKMEQITEAALEWIPGEFVLDGSGFILAALAGVALAFVGLALYGRRSGGKVFWLMVICGAVALIFISMI